MGTLDTHYAVTPDGAVPSLPDHEGCADTMWSGNRTGLATSTLTGRPHSSVAGLRSPRRSRD